MLICQLCLSLVSFLWFGILVESLHGYNGEQGATPDQINKPDERTAKGRASTDRDPTLLCFEIPTLKEHRDAGHLETASNRLEEKSRATGTYVSTFSHTHTNIFISIYISMSIYIYIYTLYLYVSI